MNQKQICDQRAPHYKDIALIITLDLYKEDIVLWLVYGILILDGTMAYEFLTSGSVSFQYTMAMVRNELCTRRIVYHANCVPENYTHKQAREKSLVRNLYKYQFYPIYLHHAYHFLLF